MTENKKIIPETIEDKPLTEAQLEEVSGGDMTLDAKPIRYKRCAVNPQHCWPYVCYVCPECGTTESI